MYLLKLKVFSVFFFMSRVSPAIFSSYEGVSLSTNIRSNGSEVTFTSDDGQPCSFEDSCEVQNVTSHSITVRWSCCEGTFFEVTSNPSGFTRDQETCKCINIDYHISMRNRNENERETEKRMSTNDCFASFENYCPYGDYSINIRSDGKYCSLTQTTLPAAPKLISTKAVAEDKIFLSWEDSYCTDYRKPIYLISWTGPDRVEMATKTSEMNTELTSLLAYTLYSITVRACDKHVDGNEKFCSANSTVQVTTKPGKPSQPTAFQVLNVTSKGVQLAWEPPLIPRGPIDGYFLTAKGMPHTLPRHVQPKDIMMKLSPSTQKSHSTYMYLNSASVYELTIFAFNYDNDNTSFLNGTETDPLSVATKLEEVIRIEKTESSDSVVRLSLEDHYYGGYIRIRTEDYSKNYKNEDETSLLRILWKEDQSSDLQYKKAIFKRMTRNEYLDSRKYYQGNQIAKDCIISDLQPNTKYTFMLEICISEKLCTENTTLKVTTKAIAPSSPLRLNATAVNISSVILTWDPPPPYPRNPIDGYIVTCRKRYIVVLNDTIFGNETTIYLAKQFQIKPECLECYCAVHAFVIGIDGRIVNGLTTTVHTATKADKPSKPEDFSVTTITSNEIRLAWNRPREPRGPIEGYFVIAHNNQEKNIAMVSRISREHRFETLNPWTEYNVTIYAFNYDTDGHPIRHAPSYLNGTQSTVLVKTKPATPSPPCNVTVAKITSEDILLKWKHPSSPGGPIDGYVIQVLAEDLEITLSGSIHRHRLTDMSPATNYTIVIFAYNMDEDIRVNGEKVVVNNRTRDLSFNEEIVLQLAQLNRQFNKFSRMYRDQHQLPPPT